MQASPSSHILVTVQLVGIFLSVYSTDQAHRGSEWSLLICCFGFAMAMWTLFHNQIGNFGIYPELKSEAVLVTTGPYEIVRHPMYFSLIVMMVGVAIFNGGLTNYLGALMVAGAVSLKALKEEAILIVHFEGYREYQARTHMIIPRLI